MARSVNKVILIGNVGNPPEVRATQDGRELANLSIATSESWNDKNTGEKKEKTEWHRISVYSPGLVNVVKNYVKKGSKLYIEGTLQTRKWQDKDGNDRYTTEVVLQNYNSNLTILDSRNEGEGNYQGGGNANTGGGEFGRTTGQFDQGGQGGGQTGGQGGGQSGGYNKPPVDDEIPF